MKNTRHCQIWGYDFSVKSFGPEIASESLHRTHFKAYGLAGQDKHGPEDKNPMYTLESLMKMNSKLLTLHSPGALINDLFPDHNFIDILKIDIESWEFETLATFVKSYRDRSLPLPFGQLQLEIHAWQKSFEDVLGWWEMLEEAGLRPFWTEVSPRFLSLHLSNCLSNISKPA